MICSRPAIVRIHRSDTHFCGIHFAAAIEERVTRTIDEEDMIHEKERVAIALSGGKDSSALLSLLNEYVLYRGGIDLLAITIDEGVSGYREETIKAAERLTSALGVEHRIVSFREIYGHDLDELLRGREGMACTVCGVLRKQLLQMEAKRCDATVLATGHCQDDEAQSVLMNYLKGDTGRIARDSSKARHPVFVRRIKPLSRIQEREVAIYGMVKGIYNELPECPYTGYALRGEARKMLNFLELRYPGTMEKLVTGYGRVRERVRGRNHPETVDVCAYCGGPASGPRCRACALIQRLVPGRPMDDLIPSIRSAPE
jgi:uncharacterized protein (TIGR00269 family)